MTPLEKVQPTGGVCHGDMDMDMDQLGLCLVELPTYMESNLHLNMMRNTFTTGKTQPSSRHKLTRPTGGPSVCSIGCHQVYVCVEHTRWLYVDAFYIL